MTLAQREQTEILEEPICRRLLTAADLAVLPVHLPSGPVRYELCKGELIIMAPPGDEHAKVRGRITTVIGMFGDFAGLGEVRGGDGGIRLQTGPDTIVGADAAFLTRDQLPPERTAEGYLVTIPALVVEVVSKNDTRKEVQEKIEDYLTAGVQVVWEINPLRRTITIHRQDRGISVLGEGDTLTEEEIIPGLSFPVARLFD